MEYKIEYRVIVRPEDFDPSEHFDDETAADIRDSAESNVWAWASVEVQAVAVFPGGTEVKACDYLGACSYGSRNEFEASDYYEDMKANALIGLEDTLSGKGYTKLGGGEA